MTLYSDPPDPRSFSQDKPTLLVCWWATIFCATIILLRLAGRYIRTERLFREDKTAALAIIPLLLRMGCVHVILIYGTNNVDLSNRDVSAEELRRRQIGSGLVLASRIFYAATLWILKSTILEFFKRLTGGSWERSSEITLLFIRITLGATFVAIVISDLSECQPFSHYWQVLPDPGGQCRQGYAQLITMAACNVITDLLLVFFPVPIILQSHMSVKRKFQLIMLFSLSLAVVGVTLYRVPHIINNNGRQQTRSLLASVELLFATTAANALVLGSFVRDRGIKKRKFKYGSTVDSIDRSSGSRSRRPTINRHWGSDEDLVRDIGLGVNPELRLLPDSPGNDGNFHPAPMANPTGDMKHWQFPNSRRKSGAAQSDDSTSNPDLVAASRSNSTVTPRKVSFFDVGGLLVEDTAGNIARRDSYLSTVDPISEQGPPASTVPASATGQRRGSTALLQDLGGLLGPLASKPRSKSVASPATSRRGTELKPVPKESPAEAQYRPNNGEHDMVLADPGGLLSQGKQ